MSPVKAFEIMFSIKSFGLGFGFCFESDFPGLLFLNLGPINFSINKFKYWKNGLI